MMFVTGFKAYTYNPLTLDLFELSSKNKNEVNTIFIKGLKELLLLKFLIQKYRTRVQS